MAEYEYKCVKCGYVKVIDGKGFFVSAQFGDDLTCRHEDMRRVYSFGVGKVDGAGGSPARRS